MYQDSPEKAAELLRQAVPLMVKHQIPPTPYNYALWYSYVSNRDPELKAAMDNTLSTHGTCPSSATDQLFENHVIKDQVADAELTRQNLKALIAEIRSQVDEVLIDADEFNRLLDDSSQSLQNEPDKLDLGNLVSALIVGTQQASDSTRMFRNRMLETQKEVESLREELKKTQQEAERDSLTGLFNRRYFERHLDRLFVENTKQNKCIILLDIDHFKRFNDTYGHLVGDKVIQRVAMLLSKSVTGGSFATRFGGEEFLLYMDGVDTEQARLHAEKVRKLVQSIVLKDRKAEKDIRRITASFGIAQLLSTESKADWLDRADKALYQAKSNGRNQVVVAS